MSSSQLTSLSPFFAFTLLVACSAEPTADQPDGMPESDHRFDAGTIDLDAEVVEDVAPTDARPSTVDAGCTIPKAADGPYLKWGLHPDASDAFTAIQFNPTRIWQTIGNASASAGTHAQDGVAGGHAYSAATDLSAQGMSTAQIEALLDRLADAGFAGWYRKPGADGWPSSEIAHLHVIWVGAPMKRSLRDQVHDWLAGKNGLASHTKYTFHTWTQCRRDAIWSAFKQRNPPTG